MIKNSALVLGAALALAVAACSSTISGHPSAGSAVTPLSSSVETNTTPDFPSSTSAGAATGCVPAADYCDTFDDPSSGWPDEDPSHYFAKYDSYNGGSYQMGERTNAAISEDAPFNVAEAASDYSVQIDVDAALGQGFGPTNEIGVVCWEHPIQGGGGTTSAFLLELSDSKATIGLWDGADGSYHEITSAAATGALSTTGWTHLTGLCLTTTSASSTQAELSLTVNGTAVISANYAKTVSTYDWDVGDRVGLLAIGEGSDVFYDNFAVTGKCASTSC